MGEGREQNGLPPGLVRRAVLLLGAYGVDDHALSLTDLVRRTGLPKTTTHRLVGELVDVRLLDRDSQGRYRLGRGLFELGMRASVERRLIEVAMPFLQDLYERTHEVVHLGLREGAEVVYVSKIGGHRQAPAPSRIGGRMPLHCTAIGKALLAHAGDELVARVVGGGLERRTPHTITAPGLLRRQLASSRETGVAYEREESMLGLLCVAAPVLDRDDRPLAAISLAGRVGRFRPEKHLLQLRAAAGGVAATLARREELIGPLDP